MNYDPLTFELDSDPTGGKIPERRGILAPFYTEQV